MPSRKHIKPLPRYTFVIQDFETEKANWLKKHSDVTRSHAAYWGGPARYKKQEEEQGTRIPPVACGRGKMKAKLKRGIHPTEMKSRIPKALESDLMHYLPSLSPGFIGFGSTINPGVSTFHFYGDDFVRQFIMSDHEDYSIMFSGCLLLSYAHYMTLTGHGTKTRLLELKDQVIRHVRTKLTSSIDPLSPQCLTAVLALGTSIVCLASRDMPKRLSVKEYIIASMDEDYLCCQDSADIAQEALTEEIVHRKAMLKLFFKNDNKYKDDRSLLLLQYVSRFLKISMAMETAYHLNVPLDDVTRLFPSIAAGGDSTVPPQWTSPLTCIWLANTSTSHFETQMLSLVEQVHRWLATFFAGDNIKVNRSREVIQERESLRQMIQGFLPIGKNVNGEEAAMYECCRWASLILLTVEAEKIPIHMASKQVRIRPRLIRRLRMTDLSNLWGIRRGLLFWVTIMCHFCTAGQCFPLLTTSLFAQFAQEIAMSPLYSEIAITPLRRLKQFESFCSSQ